MGRRRKQLGCDAPGCDRQHYAQGFCKKHYTQVARHTRLTPERERGIRFACAAPNCDRTDTLGIYCRKHARQIRVHGRLTPDREHQMENMGCKIDGCGGAHRARGLCAKHYNQLRWERIRIERLEAAAPIHADFAERDLVLVGII